MAAIKPSVYHKHRSKTGATSVPPRVGKKSLGLTLVVKGGTSPASFQEGNPQLYLKKKKSAFIKVYILKENIWGERDNTEPKRAESLNTSGDSEFGPYL